jgi:hypothetical protein
MEDKDIPQDLSKLNNVTKELCYAVDKDGNYTTALSTGWEIKAQALDIAWQDIYNRVEEAKLDVLNGKCSPITFYMEKKLMDLQILADYTGFWQWQIKRHRKPSIFNQLSEKILQKYSQVFEVTIDQLKNIELLEQ